MNRYIKAFGSLLLAGFLAACGGGGGSSGAQPGDPTDPTDPGTVNPTERVADFAVFTDKTTISNSGTDFAQLTVVTVDQNRNVVAGATVTVNTDQNSVFAPDQTVTGTDGQLTGRIQIGGDKTDRDVTATVTVNGITKRVIVRVSGSRLTLAAAPAAPTPGQAVALTATLLDAGGNPIAGQTVTLGGTIASLRGRTVTTNAAGQATVNFTAPTGAGIYTITGSASGVQALDLQVQVFTSGSAVPVANIPAGVQPSLAASPNVLAVNAPNSEANKSVLRFLMLDAGNNPVENVRVRFVDQTTGLPAVGASIASGTSTLYTDASGSVTTQYISGQNSSPTNGVTVRACYKASDFTSATDCPRFVEVNLTVAGQALSVSIGDDNLLQPSSGTYIKRFAVTVADSAGRAVANAPVDISVDITHYQKGSFDARQPLETVPSSPIEGFGFVNGDTSLPSNQLTVLPTANRADLPEEMRWNVWCPNEDVNRNGNVDPDTAFAPYGADPSRGENYNGSRDTNNQETLEPRKSDILINYDDPTKTTTDANGVLVIKAQYSQRFGGWLAYRVRVTANVAGSQGLAERLFVTDVLLSDVPTGSFNTPPYGTGRCTSAN